MDDKNTNSEEKKEFFPMTEEEERRFLIFSGIMVRKVREAQGLTIREAAEKAKEIADQNKEGAHSSFFRPILDWENGHNLPRMVVREAVAMALMLDPNDLLVDSPDGLRIRENINSSQFMAEYNALSDNTKDMVRVIVRSEYNLDRITKGEAVRPKDLLPRWFLEPDEEERGVVTKASTQKRTSARAENLQNARRQLRISIRDAAQLLEDFEEVNKQRIINKDRRAVSGYKILRATTLHAYEQGTRALNDKAAESIAAAYTYYAEEHGLSVSYTPCSIKTGINNDARLKVDFELPKETVELMKLWSKLPEETKTRVYADVHTLRIFEELKSKGGIVKKTESQLKKADPLAGYQKEEDIPTGDEEA